jgi:hypothetical protein
MELNRLKARHADVARSLRTITNLHARTAELAVNDEPGLSLSRLTKSIPTMTCSSYIPSRFVQDTRPTSNASPCRNE